MAELREFPNTFPDFDRLNPGGYAYGEEFKNDLVKYHTMLLQKQEKEMQTYLNPNDISVYTGTCGIALMYWKLYKSLGDKSHLEKCLNLVCGALPHISKKRITFACGDAGPLAIGAVAYFESGKPEESKQLVNKLYKLSSKAADIHSDLPDELLYGRVGYLFSLLFVFKYLGPSASNMEVIHSVIHAVLQSGRQLSTQERFQSPLMYEWHGKHYLGAAHGISGILFMLMQASLLLQDTALKETLSKNLKPTLDYVLSTRFASANFPSSLESNNNDKLLHWCHGAPGVFHMLAMAYKLFGDEKYLQAALECGEVVWQRGILRKGYGICHGTAGNAYVFVALYQVTNDLKHAYRASMFAKWIFDYGKHGCRIADRPYSLFEGLAGTLYFLTDMFDIRKAKFPAFDLLE